jgi:hypothetical protein
MGNAYVRFFKNHAAILSGGAAYEVVTPYSTGDLTDLRWTYIPDEKALYFAHPHHALRSLSWTSDAGWECAIEEIMSSSGIKGLHDNGSMVTSENLKTWDKGVIGIPGGSFFILKKGKNNWVALNTNRSIYISEDGETWIKSYTSATNLKSLDANEYGVIVVGCDDHDLIYSYDDGVSWVQKSYPAASATIYNTCWYDPYIERWRMVGESATMDVNSSDGVSWGTNTAIGSLCVVSNILKSKNNLWVCVGYDSTTNSGKIAYSQGYNKPWSVGLAVNGKYFIALEYGEPYGLPLWVAVTTAQDVYTSSSGMAWARVATIGNNIYDMTWLGSHYYGFSLNVLWTSEDGSAWSSFTIAEASSISVLRSVAYSNKYTDKYEWFNKTSHYPKCVTYHEGRLVIGPTDTNPATAWGSKSNVLQNFYIGQYDDQAFSYDLASDRNVAIQWMLGGTELAIGTRTAEGVLRGSPETGITPQTARMQWQSSFGSDNIQPIRIHDTIIFTQRGGEIVRGYVPGAGGEAWKSPDLTAFADHISAGGITEIDHQDDPQTVAHFVRADGQALGLTFEGTTKAWWRTKFGGDGIIESICVIPTSGAEDEIWAIVKMTVGGAVKRYIVYFDSYNFGTKEEAHFVDCGYENLAVVASATVFTSVVPQLAGKYVDVLVNGNQVEHNVLVAATGTVTITIPGATKVHIGLPYVSYAQTMRIDQNSAWGSGLGLSKRTGNLNAWVHKTIGGEFGPTSSLTEAIAYSSTTELTTDCLSVNFPGQWDKDGYIWAIQRDPLPMTVVAVAPDMEMGDR